MKKSPTILSPLERVTTQLTMNLGNERKFPLQRSGHQQNKLAIHMEKKHPIYYLLRSRYVTNVFFSFSIS